MFIKFDVIFSIEYILLFIVYQILRLVFQGDSLAQWIGFFSFSLIFFYVFLYVFFIFSIYNNSKIYLGNGLYVNLIYLNKILIILQTLYFINKCLRWIRGINTLMVGVFVPKQMSVASDFRKVVYFLDSHSLNQNYILKNYSLLNH